MAISCNISLLYVKNIFRYFFQNFMLKISKVFHNIYFLRIIVSEFGFGPNFHFRL